MTTAVAIQGTCDARFEGVKDACAQDFATTARSAPPSPSWWTAAPSLTSGPATPTPRLTRLWQRDTIANVYSTTKGITAISAHRLADQGLLDIDAPVARYWPEFAQAGKDELPMRYLLSHRTGLPAVRQVLPMPLLNPPTSPVGIAKPRPSIPTRNQAPPSPGRHRQRYLRSLPTVRRLNVRVVAPTIMRQAGGLGVSPSLPSGGWVGRRTTSKPRGGTQPHEGYKGVAIVRPMESQLGLSYNPGHA